MDLYFKMLKESNLTSIWKKSPEVGDGVFFKVDNEYFSGFVKDPNNLKDDVIFNPSTDKLIEMSNLHWIVFDSVCNNILKNFKKHLEKYPKKVLCLIATMINIQNKIWNFDRNEWVKISNMEVGKYFD